MYYVVFFKQKTAYEMRISDWSSDVCSSDLPWFGARHSRAGKGESSGDDIVGGDDAALFAGAGRCRRPDRSCGVARAGDGASHGRPWRQCIHDGEVRCGNRGDGLTNQLIEGNSRGAAQPKARNAKTDR